MTIHAEVVHDEWVFGEGLHMQIRELKRVGHAAEWVIVARTLNVIDCPPLNTERVSDLKFVLEVGGRADINPWIFTDPTDDNRPLVVIHGFKDEDDCYSLVGEIERWLEHHDTAGDGRIRVRFGDEVYHVLPLHTWPAQATKAIEQKRPLELLAQILTTEQFDRVAEELTMEDVADLLSAIASSLNLE